MCAFAEKIGSKPVKECGLRAEWNMLNKSTGKYRLSCTRHISQFLIPGNEYAISPARSYAKKDGLGLTVGQAQERNICRICGKPGADVYEFGKEHAHHSCLDGDYI